MIIGICGFIGSGKDTIADFLVNEHEFHRESFAGTLKDAVSSVFNWDRELLEGRTKEAREWREQVDPWWAERLNMPNLTPRWVLQYWGTEVCRKGFADNIWIASLENKLRQTKENVVISDCRFPNEINSIRNAGGIVIWVLRGSLPEWYQYAYDANRGDTTAAEMLKTYNIHASETAWVSERFDYTVRNNGTVDELYKKINQIVTSQVLSRPVAIERLLYEESSGN